MFSAPLAGCTEEAGPANVLGCTSSDAVNYNVNATMDDSSCDFDSDGDGVADRYDDAPFDASRSEALPEEGGGGLVYAILALLVVCGLAALLVVKRNEGAASVGSAFAEANQADSMSEAHFGGESKELPQIDEPQQWEENGVNWSKAADGTLSYWDEASSSWLVYDQ